MKYFRRILLVLFSVLFIAAPVVSDAEMKRGIRPIWWFPLTEDINSVLGGRVGTHVRASAATYINSTTGLVTAVSTNIPRFENVGSLDALLVEPITTNSCLYGRDLSQANWAKTNCTGVKDQIGEDGAANSASSLTATAADATCLQTVTLLINDHDFAISIKRITGTGDIFITDDNGGNWTDITSSISTGAWYRTDITRNQADPVVGIKIATDTDAIAVDYCQVEEGKNIRSSRIATENSTVSRATESGYPLWTLDTPLNNLFAGEGTAIVWWRPGYDYDAAPVATSSGIITSRDNTVSCLYAYHHIDGHDKIYSYDNTTNMNAGVLSSSANTWYKLIVKFGYDVGGTEKFRVGVDTGSGVSWGTEQTFDGAYTLGTYLRIGYGLFGPMHLRDLKIYNKALTDSVIDAGGSP